MSSSPANAQFRSQSGSGQPGVSTPWGNRPFPAGMGDTMVSLRERSGPWKAFCSWASRWLNGRSHRKQNEAFRYAVVPLNPTEWGALNNLLAVPPQDILAAHGSARGGDAKRARELMNSPAILTTQSVFGNPELMSCLATLLDRDVRVVRGQDLEPDQMVPGEGGASRRVSDDNLLASELASSRVSALQSSGSKDYNRDLRAYSSAIVTAHRTIQALAERMCELDCRTSTPETRAEYDVARFSLESICGYDIAAMVEDHSRKLSEARLPQVEASRETPASTYQGQGRDQSAGAATAGPATSVPEF